MGCPPDFLEHFLWFPFINFIVFIQGRIKLSPRTQMITGLSFWFKKNSNTKEKKLLHGTLKIDYQVYHSKQERKKKIIIVVV
jgi:hypothetical protein